MKIIYALTVVVIFATYAKAVPIKRHQDYEDEEIEDVNVPVPEPQQPQQTVYVGGMCQDSPFGRMCL